MQRFVWVVIFQFEVRLSRHATGIKLDLLQGGALCPVLDLISEVGWQGDGFGEHLINLHSHLAGLLIASPTTS